MRICIMLLIVCSFIIAAERSAEAVTSCVDCQAVRSESRCTACQRGLKVKTLYCSFCADAKTPCNDCYEKKLIYSAGCFSCNRIRGTALCKSCEKHESERVAEQTRIKSFTLESSAFNNSFNLPEYSAYTQQNISPPLRWKSAPSTAKSFALIMTDRDSGGRVHWALFNIPPTVSEIPIGGFSSESGAIYAQNAWGESAYHGPDPKPGDPIHRYDFTLYALDDVLNVSHSIDFISLRKFISERTIAQTQLMGNYLTSAVQTFESPHPSGRETAAARAKTPLEATFDIMEDDGILHGGRVSPGGGELIFPPPVDRHNQPTVPDQTDITIEQPKRELPPEEIFPFL